MKTGMLIMRVGMRGVTRRKQLSENAVCYMFCLVRENSS